MITLTTGLHFEVVTRSGGLPQIIEAVNLGQADLALMTASPEREEYLRFSRSLLNSPLFCSVALINKENWELG